MLINAYPEHWQTEFSAQLETLCNPSSQSVYLLLDGVFEPRLHKQLQHSALEWLSLFTLNNTGDKTVMAASPLLVQLHSSQIATVIKLLTLAQGWPAVQLFCTTESLTALAGRLAVWCVVKADEQYLNLRFPDTRRLPDLLAVLTEPQLGQFFGPATAYYYIGRNGQWQEVNLTAPALPAADEVVLSEQQTLALLRAAEPDEQLQQLKIRGITPQGLPQAIFSELSMLLLQLDQQGIADPAQRSAHCAEACLKA